MTVHDDHPVAGPRFSLILLLVLALLIPISVLMPRTMAVLPALVGLIAWLLWPLGGGGVRPLCRPALIGALGMFTLAGVSTLWAIDPAEAFERVTKIIAPLLSVVFLSNVLPRLDRAVILRWLWVFPLTVAGLCVALYLEYRADYPLYRLFRGHDADFSVRIYQLNRQTVTLMILAPVAVACLWAYLRRVRGAGGRVAGLACAALLGLYLPVMAATESQSAHLGFVLVLLMLSIWPVAGRMGRAGHYILCAGFVVSLAAMPFILPPVFAWIVEQGIAMERGRGDWLSRANILPRLEVWDAVSRYMYDSPLIGFGIEATRSVPAFDSRELFEPGKKYLHPHNAALQIWIEFGALGMVLFAAAGVWILHRVRTLNGTAHQRMALALFAGFCGVSLVSHGLWQGWWIGLIGLSLGLAMMVLSLGNGRGDKMVRDTGIEPVTPTMST